MRRAISMIMLGALLRDRGALAMSFIPPPASSSPSSPLFSPGGALSVRLAIADLRNDAASQQFLKELFENDNVRRIEMTGSTREHIVAEVGDGASDVGIVVRALAGPMSQPTVDG